MTKNTISLDSPEVMEKLDDLTRAFAQLADGELAILVAASMGRALGETIQCRDTLAMALNTMAANAICGHEHVMEQLQEAESASITRH